jgi:hypothetical protein
MSTNTPIQLADLPLWRLIVALEDAERTVGPDSGTARTLAAEIARRLQADRPPTPDAPPAREVRRG